MTEISNSNTVEGELAKYTHIVYQSAWAYIDDGGQIRKASAEELAKISEQIWSPMLAESLK